jgi:hypothetical protein
MCNNGTRKDDSFYSKETHEIDCKPKVELTVRLTNIAETYNPISLHSIQHRSEHTSINITDY